MMDENDSLVARTLIDNPAVNIKILIIRFSSIGDIVLTTPVIRCIRQQIANVEVHYLTKYRYRNILEQNPYIDQLHLLDENFAEIIKTLKVQRFNYIIDLHHNLRTLKIKRTLGSIPSFAFDKLNLQKWLLTAVKINVLPKRHIVDRYMDTTTSLGVKNDGKGLDYFVPKHDKEAIHDIPAAHLLGYIGLVIGAALATKKLPLHKLKEICTLIKHPIILLGGPEDRAAGNEIASADPIKIYNSCGKFNLNESASLVNGAKLIITHDTGLMHIAAAFKKPIISIWGNTTPAFGMTPYFGFASQPHDMLEVHGLGCRPCSKIGYAKCPLGHFKCMEKQDINHLVTLVHLRLNRQAG